VVDIEYSDLVLSTQSFILLSSNEPIYLESKTSANELTLDTNTFSYSTYKTPVGVRTDPLPKISLNRRLKKKLIRVDRMSSIGYRDLKKIKG